MMYWLIVFFFDNSNGELLLRHEIAVKNQVVCEQVRRDYVAPRGYTLQKFCVSDRNHIKQDGGISFK